jgi:hypothetical protein
MPYQTVGFGGMKTRTMTMIMQCDRGRVISFNNQKKKYYVDDSKPVAGGKKGGSVTFGLTVTDTGERMRLFGYDARHIRQKITLTPGANACQKTASQIEIDGWYADIPTFSCPMKPDLTEIQAEKGCFDEIVFEIKGELVRGVPVKEIKTIKADGQTITIEEEVTELVKTSLDAALFEPPAGYQPANTKMEILKDDDDAAQTNKNENGRTENQININSPSSTLAPPVAGVAEANTALPPKKAGVIRIGIAKPQITTPESKNDASAGTDVADAVTKSLIESLKAEKVETVELAPASPEADAKEKMCDYIFYAKVVQKRGGGGMFGKMLAMGAATAAGMLIPGVGGMIASTAGSVVMGQTMGKTAKAKDEFSFDYKVVTLDGTALAQAATKAKAQKDGEDVLSPQIKQASAAVLSEIAKKQSK